MASLKTIILSDRKKEDSNSFQIMAAKKQSNKALDCVRFFKNTEPPLTEPEISQEYNEDDELGDSVLCVSDSKLVLGGFEDTKFSENILKFVNAGGKSVRGAENSNIIIIPDCAFEGGDVLRTDETILQAGSCASLYRSARVGNFCYQFDNLCPGDYFVDLHFAEIINTNGPVGMRVFDVFIQDDKVVSELDVYSIVGANRPLQLVDIRITVGTNGVVLINFKGIHGSPIINGICIKEAPQLPVSQLQQGCTICIKEALQLPVSQPQQGCTIYDSCGVPLSRTSSQPNYLRIKYTSKYEKKIEELETRYHLKKKECYEAWLSLTTLNRQLENVHADLDNKSFQNHSLNQAMVLQEAKLKDISSMYERDKKYWVAAIDDLGRKVKTMKQEQAQLSGDAHKCVNAIPDLQEMISAVQGLVAECDSLRLMYNEEKVKRKKLYNQIQEAKGNIRVFCRCRPPSKDEISSRIATVTDFDAAKEDGDLAILTGGSTKKLYKFDRVYSPKDDQVDVFADASPLVTSVLDGYNVCIFAYGQSGTGKTFTMEGTEQNRGVNYRTLEILLKMAEERKDAFKFNISVSVLEVYNEQIRDLLATSPTSKKLEIRQASEGAHHVPGIVEAKVDNIEEVWNALRAGSNARAVGSNNVNAHSSRSHCMICIIVKAKNLMNGECTKSKLWLVDLAGSERLAKTDAQGERLKEAQNINRSLSALGDVISALATKSSHIPYRNSKLTHLLQDSLGGDSKALMFVQISPSEQDLSETLSSLNFATRVRGIELGPAQKQIDSSELQKLKLQLDKAKQELRSKDEILRKLEENIQNLEGKAKNKDQFFKGHQEKANDLLGQLELRTELCKQLEKQMMQLSDEVKDKQDICSALQKKVNYLENKWTGNDSVETIALQNKVRELESKLKEERQEFELQQMTSQEKIKELEEKLRHQHEDSTCLPPFISSERSIFTPRKRRTWSTEGTPQTDMNTLNRTILKSINNTVSQESCLLKGTDSLRELRRKQSTQNRGIENNCLYSSSITEKKALTSESCKARQIDSSSKAFARVTKSTKTFSTSEKPLSSRFSREQVQGIKERDVSSKMWSR